MGNHAKHSRNRSPLGEHISSEPRNTVKTEAEINRLALLKVDGYLTPALEPAKGHRLAQGFVKPKRFHPFHFEVHLLDGSSNVGCVIGAVILAAASRVRAKQSPDFRGRLPLASRTAPISGGASPIAA